MNSLGIMVINRVNLFRVASQNGGLDHREPALPIDKEEIFRRYRGFDGDVWPGRGLERTSADTEFALSHLHIRFGLAPLEELQQVLDCREQIDSKGECDIIAIRPTERRKENLGPLRDPPDGFRHAGLDIGFFDSEWSHYSCVLNEILWGIHPELRSFADKLNDNFLFDDYRPVKEFLSTRARLLEMGADVEAEGTMGPFEVSVIDGPFPAYCDKA